MQKITPKGITPAASRRERKAMLAVFIIGAGLIGTGVWLYADSIYKAPSELIQEEAGSGIEDGNNNNQETPIRIRIPALRIDAAVTGLNLNTDGSLQVPKKANEVGWYEAGAVPGDRGTAIMVGHLDSESGPAVFWQLKKLKSGDLVEIERADETNVKFIVKNLENYRQEDIPWGKVTGQTGTQELRLITCSGKFDRQARQYSQNLIVYASTN